jgi:hypothetical protein
VRGAVRPWHRFDRRFRRSATLGWFTQEAARPGISIERRTGEPAVMHTRGAAELQVPWLACVAPGRIASLPLRSSPDPSCSVVALAGFESAPPDRKGEVIAAIDDLIARDPALRLAIFSQSDGAQRLLDRFGDRAEIVAPLANRDARRVDVACVIQAGLTDESAFGNVLLAQAELPTVAVAGDELRALLAPDVTLVAQRGEIAAHVARFLADPDARARYGALVGADARRRFSPRRSAIRVVDLLCAARFGLERPAPALSDTPLAL